MHTIFSPSNYYFNNYVIPYVLVSVFLVFLTIFVYIQNRRSITQISFLCVCLSALLWFLGDIGVMSTRENAAAAALFWSKFVYVGITLIPPGMYFFSCAWLNTIKEKKRWILFNYLMGFVLISAIFATDKIVTGYQRHFFGNYSRLGGLSFVYMVYFLGVSYVFFKNTIQDYFRESDDSKRIQKKRIILAFSCAFLGSIDFLPTYGISIYPVGCLSIFLFNLIVAHTIIRYKLMDIETVIHKTIAWFMSNAVLFVPFVACIYLFRSWSEDQNSWMAFTLLGFITVLFLFILRRLQPDIDHFFQRRTFNLDEISSKFVDDLVHLKGLNRLVNHIEGTISDSLYPQHIDIYIFNEKDNAFKRADSKYRSPGSAVLKTDDAFLRWLTQNNRIANKEFIELDPAYASVKEAAVKYFARTKALIAIPLVLNEKLLGIINLAKKSSLKSYTAMDLHFLVTLKNQSAIAISNSLLYENMEEQVRQRTKELMAVQNQLVQAEKLATVGTLAGGVAHEINNPLTAILTNTQMLLATGELDTESLEMIEEATKRCKTIVQKLMSYAKKPLQTTITTTVNLLDMVNNAVSFLKFQLEQENINISLKASEPAYMVKGNNNELEQVITNVLLNAKDAIRAVKKGGVIDISLLQTEKTIQLRIKDEGEGIPKDIINRIFDPFFTTKEVGKGLGLGLSICQSVVEKHGGSISVQSEVKKGSVFTIQFPGIEEKNLNNSSSA